MADNSIYEVVLSIANVNGQEAKMVSHYQQVGDGSPTEGAAELNLLWRVFVANEIAELCSAAWEQTRVEVRDLLNPLDYADVAITNTGDLTGDALPAVLAVGVRSPRQPPGYNRSRHNLPLGDVTWIDANGLVDGAARTLVSDAMGILGSGITNGTSTVTWNPVTVDVTYTSGVITDVEVRRIVTGIWEVNGVFTTSKARQDYFWVPFD